MFKHLVVPVLATTLAVFAISPPSYAGHPKCGGVAPAAGSCSVEFTDYSATPYGNFYHYMTFTGAFAARISTATGYVELRCHSVTSLPPHDYDCQTDGAGIVSGPGTLTGTTNGVGLWMVAMESVDTCNQQEEFVHCFTLMPL